VPSLEVAYVWHASKFTREVLDGLLRIGFLHHQQIIWNKGRTVLTRTHYWFQPLLVRPQEERTVVRKGGQELDDLGSPSPKFIMGGSDEEKFDHPTQKPVELMRRPILNHIRRGELVYEPFLGSGTTLAAAELTERVCFGMELDPKYVDVIVQRWQALTRKRALLEADGRTFEAVAAERAGVATAATRRLRERMEAGRRRLAEEYGEPMLQAHCDLHLGLEERLLAGRKRAFGAE
jgi:DNA modification methylase